MEYWITKEGSQVTGQTSLIPIMIKFLFWFFLHYDVISFDKPNCDLVLIICIYFMLYFLLPSFLPDLDISVS
jgi:hypothetical protein